MASITDSITDNIADSVVNIAIPKIANTELLNKIIKLSSKKLIKVLELGIIAYESMENQKQRWENSDFNSKIKNIECSQKEKEKKFINELDSKNRIIKDLRREFSEKQTHLHKQIEDNVSLNYQSQLNFKDKTINKITKELKESNNNNNTLRDNYGIMEMSRRIELTKEHKNEMQELRNTYDKKIDKLQESIMSIQKNKDNSSIKGKVGEDKMKQILTMLFPKNEIEDTHSSPGRGDFIITCKNDKKILIDNKDYSSNVPKKEIDKFEKDIRENADVFGGLLISNSSGVSKKDDFQIDIINSKPVMYLHNTNNNNNKIKCAIDLIESILCANHIDFQDKEICDKLSKISSEIKRKINKIKRDMDKHAKNIIETVLNIETLVKDVFLNTKTKY
tara:strand:- start:9681 stop:10856 length:1176 start_codon:yes stop_codon:yes gene_type:complete